MDAAKIKELEAKLPHGSKKEIAERAGVRPGTISQFFNGKSKSRKILEKVVDYILELEAKDQLQEKLNRALGK